MTKESGVDDGTVNESASAEDENPKGMDSDTHDVVDHLKENRLQTEQDPPIHNIKTTAVATPSHNHNDDDDHQQQRPVKRARTAYFIFAEEKRPEIQKQHPGEGVAVVARAIGALWGNLTESEKKPYQEKAAAEREQVKLAVEAWKAAGGTVSDALISGPTSASTDDNNHNDLIFPVARIRKICKLDPEVRGLSKEALLLLTKASELALIKLSRECVKTAAIQNRRKLLASDVASVSSTREQFLFLQPDIQDLHNSILQQQQQTNTAGGTNTNPSKAKKNAPSSTTTEQPPADANIASKHHCKPLTNYFAVRKTESES